MTGRLGLVAVVLLNASAGGASQGWHRESVTASMPGVGGYSVALPPTLRKVPVTGIRSDIAEYHAPDLNLLFDLGAHEAAPPSCRGKRRCTIGSLAVVGGRARRLRAYVPDPDGGLPYRADYDIPFPKRPGMAARRISLTVHAECASAAACDRADRIVRTIEIHSGR